MGKRDYIKKLEKVLGSREISKAKKALLDLANEGFFPVRLVNNKLKISVWGNDNIKTPSGYIQNLIDHIRDDIYPLFFLTSGGAPFTILRNLFCYLDHTARLRFGNNQDSLDKLFCKGDFGAYKHIQKRYCQIHKDLIQLYRHELAHHIRPWPKIRKVKIEKSRERKLIGFHISWEVNKKMIQAKFEDFAEFAEFMRKEKNRKHLNHLRSSKYYPQFIVNTFCFLSDIVDYLNRYAIILDNKEEERLNFCKNYLLIVALNLFKPNNTLLILDKKIGSRTDVSEQKIKDWYEHMRTNLLQELQ